MLVGCSHRKNDQTKGSSWNEGTCKGKQRCLKCVGTVPFLGPDFRNRCKSSRGYEVAFPMERVPRAPHGPADWGDFVSPSLGHVLPQVTANSKVSPLEDLIGFYSVLHVVPLMPVRQFTLHTRCWKTVIFAAVVQVRNAQSWEQGSWNRNVVPAKWTRCNT